MNISRALPVFFIFAASSLAAAQEIRTFTREHWFAPDVDLSRPIESATEYLALRQKAIEAARVDDHGAALEALDRALAFHPHDGALWVSAATSAYAVSDYRRAIGYYTRAIELGAGWKPVVLTYNVACCYALLGEIDNAFAWLERALLEERWADRQQLLTDSDLESLRDDPRWAKLVSEPTDQSLTRDQRWVFDIEFLKGEVERLHVPRGQGVGAEAVLDRLDHVAKRVSGLSDAEICVRLQAAIAGLGDGHSFVFHTTDPGSIKQLPFAMRWFPSGLYIVSAQPGYEEYIGASVHRLGNLTPDELLPKIGAQTSMDNAMNSLWVGPIFLGFPEVLRHLGCIDSLESVTVRLTTRAGQEIAREFSFAPRPFEDQNSLRAPAWVDTPPRWLQPTDLPFTLETLDAGPLYVRFLAVRDGPEESISAFASRLIATIDEHDPPALIVDVRQNGGGNGNLLAPFLRALAHYQNTKPGRPIFMLTSRSTFSAAQVFINLADRFLDITFAGEPSGSRANFAGESNLFTLPYSGVLANISNRYHQPSRFHDHRVWIAPDVPVYHTAEDFFTGKDPVLDTVLHLVTTHGQ